MNYPVQQYPPQYPVAPQPQAYAPQPVYAQPPVQQFPQAPPMAPQVPLATGTIDDYYAQPTTGDGKSISWKDKPLGTTYAGVIARDVHNGDVQQSTNFTTKQPEFYRDGRPKFVLKVPLKVNPQQFTEFPEGDCVLFVRGRMRDELQRAMAEAGVSGAPKGGDFIQVTLVDKKQSGQGMSPANVFAIVYTPAGATGAPSPAPVPQPVQQVAAPQPVPQVQPPYAPQVAPMVDPYAQTQAVPQAAPVAQAPVPQAAPAPQLALPEGMSPEQQALLARLQGGQG